MAVAEQRKQFARNLIEGGLLPEGEFNDGLIVAETALAYIPVLVTSDGHLLGMQRELLLSCLMGADLSPVEIAHPKPLLAAMRRIGG